MASYTESMSVEASTDEFDLFTVPPTYAAVDKQYYMTYRPTSQITTDSSPIEFNISGQGVDYIDLRRTHLHVQAKILKTDGTDITTNEKTAPVNLWLQSLFSQVDLSLNGKLITSSTNLYPYKSYIKVLLNETTSVKQSLLQSQLYYKDSAHHLDESDPNSSNTGLFGRYEYTRLGTVDMCGPLYEDLMDSKRYLINGVDLQIRMFRTPAAFNLMSGEDSPSYKVKIEDIYLRMCKIRPSSAITTSHAKILTHHTAKYPFTKSDIKLYLYPKDS
ncbi:uncharacterized protein LOC124267006 [Haliotis rubra]|uniref:uncharacterized protein LOC124267006 n=1 Tax=Haliotis rubra TaxID=36100 RepID=UPI001EE61186|nr:uncharacterized protein LOC124267006 [Haliotis rubra]